VLKAFFRNVNVPILIGEHLAVDGDLWDAHPGHKAPVPPHPKDALLEKLYFCEEKLQIHKIKFKIKQKPLDEKVFKNNRNMNCKCSPNFLAGS